MYVHYVCMYVVYEYKNIALAKKENNVNMRRVKHKKKYMYMHTLASFNTKYVCCAKIKLNT